jgi:hypothetical protein
MINSPQEVMSLIDFINTSLSSFEKSPPNAPSAAEQTEQAL